MKDKIEHLIKESLEGYATPYNPGAWDALSQRLGTPSVPFYKKWWFAASVAVVAVTGTLIAVSSPGNPSTTPAVAANTTQQEVPTSGTVAQAAGDKIASNNDQTTATSSIAEERQVTAQQAAGTNPAVLSSETSTTATNNPGDKLPVNGPGALWIDDKKLSTPDLVNFEKLNLPKTVCLNQEIEIVNPNKSEAISVKQAGTKTANLRPGSKTSFVAASEGVIEVVSGTHTDRIEVVKPEGNLYISQVSDSPYENGIPEVRLEVSGAENVSWSTDAASFTQKGKTLIVHPFKEMAFDVTVTSKDAQGCKITEKKTIRMEERYNLMAENAFNPSSSIPRNRTFMPEALNIRDVAFELSIVDPKNGSTVYQTSDASQGWDGTDQRNGERAHANSIWLWKVVIKNPLQGEPRVYNGTVQVVENK